MEYHSSNLPLNKPVWAFQYWYNDEAESKQKYVPTHGEITWIGDVLKFVPYKKGTMQKRTSGYISYSYGGKSYAETQVLCRNKTGQAKLCLNCQVISKTKTNIY